MTFKSALDESIYRGSPLKDLDPVFIRHRVGRRSHGNRFINVPIFEDIRDCGRLAPFGLNVVGSCRCKLDALAVIERGFVKLFLALPRFDDMFVDILRRGRGTIGEFSNGGGDNGKAISCLARPRSLDRGIDGQKTGLPRYRADLRCDAANLLEDGLREALLLIERKPFCQDIGSIHDAPDQLAAIVNDRL